MSNKGLTKRQVVMSMRADGWKGLGVRNAKSEDPASCDYCGKNIIDCGEVFSKRDDYSDVIYCCLFCAVDDIIGDNTSDEFEDDVMNRVDGIDDENPPLYELTPDIDSDDGDSVFEIDFEDEVSNDEEDEEEGEQNEDDEDEDEEHDEDNQDEDDGDGDDSDLFQLLDEEVEYEDEEDFIDEDQEYFEEVDGLESQQTLDEPTHTSTTHEVKAVSPSELRLAGYRWINQRIKLTSNITYVNAEPLLFSDGSPGLRLEVRSGKDFFANIFAEAESFVDQVLLLRPGQLIDLEGIVTHDMSSNTYCLIVESLSVRGA